MLKFRYLLLVVLASYLITLVLTIPANLVWSQVSPMVRIPGLSVSSVQGQIWKGRANVNWRQQEAQLHWDIKGWYLLLGSLNGDIKVEGMGVAIDSRFDVNFSGFELQALNGYLDDQWINPELTQNRVSFNGRIWMEDLIFQGRWDRLLTDAQGQVRWTGGPVSYPVGRDVHRPEIVPLTASLQTSEQGVQLLVQDPDKNRVVTGLLDHEGWGSLQVYKQLLVLAGEPWPESGRDLILDLKQKVF